MRHTHEKYIFSMEHVEQIINHMFCFLIIFWLIVNNIISNKIIKKKKVFWQTY